MPKCFICTKSKITDDFKDVYIAIGSSRETAERSATSTIYTSMVVLIGKEHGKLCKSCRINLLKYRFKQILISIAKLVLLLIVGLGIGFILNVGIISGLIFLVTICSVYAFFRAELIDYAIRGLTPHGILGFISQTKYGKIVSEKSDKNETELKYLSFLPLKEHNYQNDTFYSGKKLVKKCIEIPPFQNTIGEKLNFSKFDWSKYHFSYLKLKKK